jgi:hypothetical protein
LKPLRELEREIADHSIRCRCGRCREHYWRSLAELGIPVPAEALELLDVGRALVAGGEADREATGILVSRYPPRGGK